MEHLLKRKGVLTQVYGQRPPKVRSAVTINNFKKFRPKVLVKQGIPPVRPKLKIKSTKPAPTRLPTPREIPLDKPKKKIIRKKPTVSKPSNPPPKPAAQETQRPQRSLLKEQLSQLRRAALERARSANQRRVGKRGGGGGGVKTAPTVHRERPPLNRKAIESLKNIGMGRMLVMIAAGPSVREVDLKPLVGHPLIDMLCVNKPLQSVWPTRFWTFCDHTQYKANQDTWNAYNGIIINSPNVRARKANQIMVRSRSGSGFSTDLARGYHIGRSSTYASMQSAYYMSYKKVYIFGCDMGEVNGIMHHYGQNPDVSNEHRKSRFPAEAKHYMWAAKNLSKEVRSRFVFCSSYNKWEFTKYFEKMDHKEAVKNILEYADNQ